MSAIMFPDKNKTPDTSRIPIPSPTPLRRNTSLQLCNEKYSTTTTTPKLVPSTVRRQTDPTRRGSYDINRPQQENTIVRQLKRGNSFMERGERCGGHGVRPSNGAVVANRPHHLKTESRNSSALQGATTPQSPSRLRSLSLSLSNTRLNQSKSPSIPNTISPGTRNYSVSTLDWDTESITSINSVASCDHASVARNGTTFSGRSMKYVFHCNQHAGAIGEDYLTPTQRAHRQVKKLKYLLQQAKNDLEQKDSDILKLTKEVVELRLYKAALNSPEDKSNSSDAVTVRENTTPETDAVDNNVQNHVCDNMSSSFADSGHFEDGTNSSVHSKDSVLFDDLQKSPCKSKPETSDKAVLVQISNDVMERNQLIMEYERRLQELVRTHEEESYQLKQKHNDKVEELLQRITEINKRYWELVPELEIAKDRIKELESQLEDASKKLEEHEERQKEALLEKENVEEQATKDTAIELAHQHPSRVSVPELLQELQVTKNELEKIKDVEYASSSNNLQPLLSAKEALSLWVLGARKAMYRQLMEAKSKNKIDPEITLQFLKSAVYYFLTDKENSLGHLRAIESILGFTSNEISNIDKARLS